MYRYNKQDKNVIFQYIFIIHNSITDDIGRPECGKITVVRILYVYRCVVDYQLYVRYYRAESVSNQ